MAHGDAGRSPSGGGKRGPSLGGGERRRLGGRRERVFGDPWEEDGDEEMGEQYYFSLPRPWNVLPTKEARAGEVYKMTTSTLPKFDGRQASYSKWRSCFIPCVHKTDIDVEYKCLLLRTCMDTTTARMREFVNSVGGNALSYKMAIETLEDRYGGSEALMLSRQETLLSVPELREGDLRVVELLHSRLNTFLQECEEMDEGMDETESLAFYSLLMSRVEYSYTLRYLDWLRVEEEQKGLHSLRDWLGQQLQDHRSAEAFQRRRSASLRPLRGEQPHTPALGHRRPSLPSSHMDRNYQKGSAFLTLEDQWEAAEPGEGDDEAANQIFMAQGQQQSGNLPRQSPPCSLCQAAHPLGRCDRFQALTPRQRKEFLVRENRCFLCFQRSHPVTRCRFPYKCKQCGGRHHTMIHEADEGGNVALVAGEGEDDLEGAGELLEFGLVAGGGKRGAVSLRTLPLWIKNPANGKLRKINALLDDGCTSAGMLSTTMAEELGLQGPAHWTTTEGVGGKITTYRTFLSQVEVRQDGGGRFFPLGVQIMRRPAGSYLPVDWTKHQTKFGHLAPLPLAPPAEDGQVHLLIGSRVPSLTLALDERVGRPGDPVARRTPLGWTITGPTDPDLPPDKSAALTALLCETAAATPVAAGDWPPEAALVEIRESKPVRARQEVSDRQLQRLLERLLREEEAQGVEVLSPREEFIVKQAKSTLTKRDGRYQVSCTWAPGGSRPPLNTPQAEQRLRSLESSKHFADPNLKEAYTAVVKGSRDGRTGER